MAEISGRPWCDGYRDLRDAKLQPLTTAALLQQQRPWHSGITLPSGSKGDGQNGQQKLRADGHYDLWSYDVDILIVTMRMLLSLGFVPEDKYLDSDVLHCAYHDFGWDMNADYAVKGMLISKLFPNEEDYSVLESRLTLERLFEHPAVKEVIFGNFGFILKDIHELTGPKDDPFIENIRILTHNADSSHVHWDGTTDIAEAVGEQAWTVAPDPEDMGNRVRVRYAGRASFIRVTYTPKSTDPPKFDQLKRFKLTAPCLVPTGDNGVRPAEGRDYYALRIAIRCFPKKNTGSAEIRLFDPEGDSISGHMACDDKCIPMMVDKLRPEKNWTIGEKGSQYILLYCRISVPGTIDPSSPPPPRGTRGEAPSLSPETRRRRVEFNRQELLLEDCDNPSPLGDKESALKQEDNSPARSSNDPPGFIQSHEPTSLHDRPPSNSQIPSGSGRSAQQTAAQQPQQPPHRNGRLPLQDQGPSGRRPEHRRLNPSQRQQLANGSNTRASVSNPHLLIRGLYETRTLIQGTKLPYRRGNAFRTYLRRVGFQRRDHPSGTTSTSRQDSGSPNGVYDHQQTYGQFVQIETELRYWRIVSNNPPTRRQRQSPLDSQRGDRGRGR
ncbi:hypothetical protein F5Y13DRAFT_199348 [Hypoxylon sp. FL1857]|nr:hypothetical protein F5Y13DRAFT_199348 [Hypoxylon sp. FL1857]